MRATIRFLWIVCLLGIGGGHDWIAAQSSRDSNPEGTRSVQCPPGLRQRTTLSQPQNFKSGMAPPSFSSPFYLVTDPDGLAQRFGNRILVRKEIRTAIADKEFIRQSQGTFYYLGFRHNFENYYFETRKQSYPPTARFRVGLRHGGDANPEEAGFAHFRIRVLDSNGDDVLGFKAATVVEPFYDEGMMLALGWADPFYYQRQLDSLNFMMGDVDARIGVNRPFTTIRRSNRHAAGPLPAIHERGDAIWDEYFVAKPNDRYGMNGFYVRAGSPFLIRDARKIAANQYAATVVNLGLTYGNVLETAWLNKKGNDPEPGRRLFALPPDQVYDFPPEIFTQNETLTLEAWAVNQADQAISPVRSLALGTQVRFQAAKGVLANNRFDFPNPQISAGLLGYNFYYTWDNTNADPAQKLIEQYGAAIDTNLDFGGLVLDMVVLEEK